MTHDIIQRREIAALFGVSTETINRWIKTGKLPAMDFFISTHKCGWNRSTLADAGVNLSKKSEAEN